MKVLLNRMIPKLIHCVKESNQKRIALMNRAIRSLDQQAFDTIHALEKKLTAFVVRRKA